VTTAPADDVAVLTMLAGRVSTGAVVSTMVMVKLPVPTLP